MEVKIGERRCSVIVAALLGFLAPVVGEDCLRGVVARIARDVKCDLVETADREFNDSDLQVATLLDGLGTAERSGRERRAEILRYVLAANQSAGELERRRVEVRQILKDAAE